MLTLLFNNKEHEMFFWSIMAMVPNLDIYRKVFFYIMGLTAETRDHIKELYNFREGCIAPENMNAPWQTFSTRQVCFLAYNLYNGYYDPDSPDTYTPYFLFCSPFAPYFVCALNMLYQRYFDAPSDDMIIEGGIRWI